MKKVRIRFYSQKSTKLYEKSEAEKVAADMKKVFGDENVEVIENDEI